MDVAGNERLGVLVEDVGLELDRAAVADFDLGMRTCAQPTARASAELLAGGMVTGTPKLFGWPDRAMRRATRHDARD